jgi:hypothetical protein
MLNRVSAVEEIMVYDLGSWTATYKLVADMNTEYGRCECIEGGAFTDKVRRLDWLARLANLVPA